MALSQVFLLCAVVYCAYGINWKPALDDELPGSNIFSKLAPGQISIKQYVSILAKPTGYSRRNDNEGLIRDSDVVLTPKQYRYLYTEPKKVGAFKAEVKEVRRWTDNIVPYTIDANHFSESQLIELHIAIETLMNTTCLNIRPKQDSDKNWVKFTDNNSGCNSMLGMMNWGEQSVNLGSGCKWRGLYLHEIGHALGLIHEHQRPDRDAFVNVIWRRVKTDYLDAFTLYKNDDVNNYGIPYDYSSIMHYEPEAFNDDQEITTQPRTGWKIELMYRVFYKTLSFTDTKVLNLMYKCGKQCGKQCQGNAYLDKDCNCVTPQDIYKELCYNEKPDEECYRRVKKGECGDEREAVDMNIHCRKACGSCPTYGRDAEIEPRLSQPLDACVDRYHESARCVQWAAEGACDRHPSWMKRYCRKSCNSCAEKKNNCRNYYHGAPDDAQCDSIAANKECGEPVKRAGCQDSCNACGYQIPGKCEDDHGGCIGPALRGECDHPNPFHAAHIQSVCRKSCNTCDLNQGKCTAEQLVDQLPSKECLQAGSQGKCRIEPQKYKKQCKQVCNSCKFGIVDKSCDDVYPVAYCAGHLRSGDCEENKGYALRFCASSCSSCDYARNPPCEDLKDGCADWAKREECTANHQFMSTHCPKSCNTCDRLVLGTCHNLDHDAYCEESKLAGQCEKYGLTMEKDCRRSCGYCEAPKIERFWECKDLLPDRCEQWAKTGECESNPINLKAYCSKSCGHCPSGK